MAQITLWGATYSDVPAVELPATGGGTATFYDAVDGDELEYGSEPTDSWYFNPQIRYDTNGDLVVWSVDFTNGDTDYDSLTVVGMAFGGGILTGVSFGDVATCEVNVSQSCGTWIDDAYRTITITGGTDAENAQFRAFLAANATQLYA